MQELSDVGKQNNFPEKFRTYLFVRVVAIASWWSGRYLRWWWWSIMEQFAKKEILFFNSDCMSIHLLKCTQAT